MFCVDGQRITVNINGYQTHRESNAMKSKLITVFAVLLGVTLGFCSLSQAGTDITQITSNSYEDSFPQIKGDYLVWQGQVDGDWEIFVYDIATGEGPVRITDND